LTESEPYKAFSGGNNSGGVDKSDVNDNNSIINTYNNDSVDKPRINKNSVNDVNISINKNNGDIDKPSKIQSNAGTNNINTKKAKFDEDIKKEPILQTIIDMFDGELLI
jgi:hypothetical protein